MNLLLVQNPVFDIFSRTIRLEMNFVSSTNKEKQEAIELVQRQKDSLMAIIAMLSR